MRRVLPLNAKRIKYYRLVKGMKATELAKLTGLTRASISAYEKGIQMPTGKNILKIAEVLEVEPKDLISAEE